MTRPMNLPTFVDKPDTHNDIFFEELLMEAEYLKMDNETQVQYERRVKQMRDAKNVEDYMIKTSIAKGMKQGLEKGMEKGIEKGMKQGLEKGMAEGMEKAKFEMAKNLLRLGVELEIISEATGLSKEELSSLQ